MSYTCRTEKCFALVFVVYVVPQLVSGASDVRNSSNNDAYVGSRACLACHSEIYRSYKKTGMGKSMSLVNSRDALLVAGGSVTVQNQKLHRWFDVLANETDISQSEFELDANGLEIFRDTHSLMYAIGSGHAGRTYLVRRGTSLFEAPLSYYSRPAKWDLSPGYESGEVGFSRRVDEACLTCHTGRVQLVLASEGNSSEQNAADFSVYCENCHGPGQQHVKERSAGIPGLTRLHRVQPGVRSVQEGGDTSIVNPRRLQDWLADNICMSCHEASSTRVLRPGKSFSDFRPGLPLDETAVIFAIRSSQEASRSMPLQHYTSMVASQCYRASRAKLGCLSCHDPHSEPIDPASYFRQKCLACHADADCRLSLAVRQARVPANDCAGCHMPKRGLREISHSALTDHRIVVRSDEPYPADAIAHSGTVFGSLVHVNAIPGQPDQVPAITLLEAYSALVPENPSLEGDYNLALDRAATTNPNSASVLSKLGWRCYKQDTPDARIRAIAYFQASIARDSKSAADYSALGDLLLKSGRSEEAVVVLRKGIALDQYYPRSYKLLALCYIALGRYKEALDAMRQALDVFPEDSAMRNLLRRAQLPQ
jgi:hypothetical protein